MIIAEYNEKPVPYLSFLRINVSVRLKNPTGNFLILHLLDRFCRKRNSLLAVASQSNKLDMQFLQLSLKIL